MYTNDLPRKEIARYPQVLAQFSASFSGAASACVSASFSGCDSVSFSGAAPALFSGAASACVSAFFSGAASACVSASFVLFADDKWVREMCSFIHEVTPRAPTRLKTCGSRLGSLNYDIFTTLAVLPRRIRHDQPNESRQRPCGREAGGRTPRRAPRPPPTPPRGTGTWRRAVVGAPRSATA